MSSSPTPTLGLERAPELAEARELTSTKARSAASLSASSSSSVSLDRPAFFFSSFVKRLVILNGVFSALRAVNPISAAIPQIRVRKANDILRDFEQRTVFIG